jgi:hypothetical protein
MTVATKIREWHDVDVSTFREQIYPLGQPAVLKGLVSHWPAVKESQKSPQAVATYLRQFVRPGMIESFTGDAAIRGRFFYDSAMRGYNFERRKESLIALMDRVLAHMDDPQPPSVYAGSVLASEHLPEFARDHFIELIDRAVPQRIWIGNALTVSTHYDLSDNIACVVAGHRCFTVFPPEQLPNLYVGPIEFTLAGQPVSMVSLEEPDFERYPRFREALATAQTAQLDPGDAIYIPYLWWHHVKSLDAFNLLVNYWWDDAPPWLGSPFDVLVHAIMAIRSQPPERREQWRKIFEHYVFADVADSVAHLAPEHRGILGAMSPRVAQHIRAWLMHSLNRQ